MTTIKAFIKRHSVLAYYILTFAISWGGALLVVGGLTGFPSSAEESARLLPLFVVALVAGPVVSGILLTGLVDGRAGLRELVSRFLKWRVGVRWYAVALLTAPLVMLATLFALSLTSPDYVPSIFTSGDGIGILLPGLAAGLTAGLMEEPGWTGFVIPRLRLRYSIFAVGLIVGLLWGVWHFIAAYWGSGSPSGEFSLLILINQLAFYVVVLPAYRLLMVWVYDHTESLLVAMLMHGSLTAVTTFIFAPPVTDFERLIYHLTLGGVMWVVVGAVALANRGNILQRSFQRRAA